MFLYVLPRVSFCVLPRFSIVNAGGGPTQHGHSAWFFFACVCTVACCCKECVLGRIWVVFLSCPLCTKGTTQIWGRMGLDLFASSAVGHGFSSEVAVQHLEPRVWVGLASIGASTFQHFNIGSISTFQHFPPSTFQDFNISAQRGSKEETHSKQHVEMLKC